MATAKRKYHHGDLKNALLEAAEEILENEGLQAISMRSIAKGAGVSQAAPYSHFKDKNALLVDVAANGFEKLKDYLSHAMEGEATKRQDSINKLGVAYVQFATSHKAIFRLMFGDDLSDVPKNDRYMEEGGAAYLIMQNAIIGQDGDVSKTRAAWSIVHGLATLVVDNKLEIDTSDQEEIAKILSHLSV